MRNYLVGTPSLVTQCCRLLLRWLGIKVPHWVITGCHPLVESTCWTWDSLITWFDLKPSIGWKCMLNMGFINHVIWFPNHPLVESACWTSDSSITWFGFRTPSRKRQKIETLPESKTVTSFASMIGRGRCSIDAAAELARDIDSIFVSAKFFYFTYTQSKWKILTGKCFSISHIPQSKWRIVLVQCFDWFQLPI